MRISRKGNCVLARFDRASRAFEFRNAHPVRERALIKENYREAKREIREYIRILEATENRQYYETTP